MVKQEIKHITNLIIEFFKKKYKAEAIVFVGSRAVGDYKPNSDWDMYIFTKKEIPKETPFEFCESLPKELSKEDFDLYIHDFNTENYKESLYKNFRFSEVVLDTKDKFAQKLREEALRIYEKGPKKWSKELAQARVKKAKRYIKKFEDNLQSKKNEELFLRMSWHLDDIITWWFGAHNEFRLRPQEVFQHIKKKDPKFYSQIEIVSKDTTNYETKVKAFRKMHELLFESEKFKELIR